MSQYQPTRHAPHRMWIEFEAPEVIELKRIVLDKDAETALAFFQDVIVPRVRAPAERHGIPLPSAEASDHDRLPG